jgi:internalin A
MRVSTSHLTAAALAVAMFAPVACNPNSGPIPVRQTGTRGTDEESAPSEESSRPESPEVAAYFQTKNWPVTPGTGFPDGRRRTMLFVHNPEGQRKVQPVSPEDLAMIARAQSVRAVCFARAQPTGGLGALADAPVEAVQVLGEGMTSAELQALAALPALRVLHFEHLACDEAVLRAVGRAKQLKVLELSGVEGLTDTGAREVAKLPNLDRLVFKNGFGRSQVTPAGIRAIVATRLPPVFEFDKQVLDDDLFAELVAEGWLYGPPSPGGRSPRPASAADLTTIDLDSTRVGDRGFAAIRDCVNVTRVFADRAPVTDEAVRMMAGFRLLEFLSVDETRVTGTGLKALAGLPVKLLSMKGCSLSEDAFKGVAGLPALETLLLASATFPADGPRHLAGHPTLKDLSMSGAHIGDEVVSHLVTLPSLEKLSLESTKLTDDGFRRLVRLPQLKELGVHLTAVSKEARAKAKQDRPDLKMHD